MSRVENIEREVEALSPAELTSFRKWFASFDARAWDRQLEQDAEAGRLDTLADEALKEHQGGNTSLL